MSFPKIDGNEHEPVIVKLLAMQVLELVNLHRGLREAIASVCTYRYNGRFYRLKAKVQARVNESLKPGTQQELPFNV